MTGEKRKVCVVFRGWPRLQQGAAAAAAASASGGTAILSARARGKVTQKKGLDADLSVFSSTCVPPRSCCVRMLGLSSLLIPSTNTDE